MAALASKRWLRRSMGGGAPGRGSAGIRRVNGVVTDPTGSVAAGAEIALTNVDTGVVRTITSSNEGAPTFSSMSCRPLFLKAGRLRRCNALLVRAVTACGCDAPDR